MINLLHISDLHYTAATNGLRSDYSKAAVKAILELARELQSLGVIGRPLAVAITGDLVQAGGAGPDHGRSDFEAVQADFLEPLCDILQIAPGDIYLVPGNHEMDRDAVLPADYLSAGSQCSESDIASDLRAKLRSYFDFVEGAGYQSVTRERPRLTTFNLHDQQIVCINALAGSYSRPGFGDKGEIFVLPTELPGNFSNIEDFAVVLMHHPLSWYSDPCETLLREFFAKKRCRVLTGHIHNLGVTEISTNAGSFVSIQAGASSETGNIEFCVALEWLPRSNSAAVRHFIYDSRQTTFPIPAASETKFAPASAASFFSRSEAFFDPSEIERIATAAAKRAEDELYTTIGVSPDKYVPPDVMYYPEDLFSGKRVRPEDVLHDNKNIILSGYDLSGKSGLISYLCYLQNRDQASTMGRVGLSLDFREMQQAGDLEQFALRRLTELGASNQHAEYLLGIGKVRLFIDNFDANERLTVKRLQELTAKLPLLRWTMAIRGSEKFMPSRAPSDFIETDTSYYQTVETTLPTVLKLIENHASCENAEKPRAVVQRVFQSIHNLSAPRTMFYVRSMLDIFLTDASVEPLNRYLLIENLISERIRAAHREIFPGQPVDMQMLDAFIGQLAYDFLKKETSFVNRAEFLSLVEVFIEKKGLQRKRFDPDKVLEILLTSHVLRSYEAGFGFILLSVEDYFLAKHMGHDDRFRAEVLSADGLLRLPAAAEYYVAQNPNDRPRIDRIFAIIDEFETDVAPVVSEIEDDAVAAIKFAAPGSAMKMQNQLLDEIADVDDASGKGVLRIPDPEPLGDTKRVTYSVEERGAVLLQLGASVLGVTRTLDQDDRIEIFRRLRRLLLICVKGLPLICQHLADGHEVKLRGTTVKAEYIGHLAVQEDRFYLILRGMLYNLLKHFSTWAGSPSFFNSAVRLRRDEDDEIVSSALFAQNIQADLSEALEFIGEVSGEIESALLQEILVRLYLDAMTLVPLEREEEARALDKLVDLTATINPPKKDTSGDALVRHKDRLRRNYSEMIGINTYIGRRVRAPKWQGGHSDKA